MPICQNCHKQWSWKQTVKKMFTLDTSMICPHCGKKQLLTTQSKKRAGLLNFLTPLAMLFGVLFNLSVITIFILIIASGVIVIAAYPFLVELTEEDEPLW
ncbi:TIGR04104 family putative zinc finger protein [Planococcus rifietoensis]|uniref:TIGR04104 family putative zinc finger protein n=1 Tax=Planococcus rifietoensis TaxID=200991 RepID=UPI00384EAF77